MHESLFRRCLCIFLALIFVFLLVPNAYADTTTGKGCRLSAWWDDNDHCIKIVAECRLDKYGADKELFEKVKPKDVIVNVIGNGKKSEVKMSYDSDLDDQTYFRCHGQFKPEDANSGDKFMVEAQYKGRDGKVFNKLSIDVVCGEVDKPYKITRLEASYVEDKENPTGAIEIHVSSECPMFGVTVTRLYIDGKEVHSSTDSSLSYVHKPASPKDGQTYTVTAKLFSNGEVKDQATVKVVWGRSGQTDGSTQAGGESGTRGNEPQGSYTPGPFEKVLAAPIEGLATIVEKLFGITPENELIFNHDDSGKKIDKSVGPFDKEDWDRLVWWYTLSAGFVGVLMAFSFVTSGYRTMISPIANPSKQADAKLDMMHILLAVFITMSALLIFHILCDLNGWIVDFFYAATVAKTGNLPNAMALSQDYSGTLGGALVRLAFVGIRFYLNFLYVIRKFVLAAILVLTPFFAFSWAAGRNSQAIGVWIGELTSNVFMQAAHAVTLSLYFTMFASEADKHFWVPIVALSALIPISEVVRNLLQGYLKWLGVPEEKWAGKVFGAMTGMGAVAGLIGLGAMSLKSGVKAVPGATPTLSGGIPGAPGSPVSSIPGGPVTSPSGGPVSPGIPGGSVVSPSGGPAVSPGGSSAQAPVGSVPPGWTQTSTGLVLPAEYTGSASGASSGSGSSQPMPSLSSAARRGQSVGTNAAQVAQNVGQAVGQMSLPGAGGFLGGVVSAATGIVTRTASTAYHAFKGYQEIRERLGSGATMGEALKQFAGTDSTWKAAAKLAGAVTLSSIGAGHWVARDKSIHSRSVTP